MTVLIKFLKEVVWHSAQSWKKMTATHYLLSVQGSSGPHSASRFVHLLFSSSALFN